MLVLTRKIGESVQIGDDVSVEVLEVRGGRVRLGICAPGDVSVTRSELLISMGARSGVFEPRYEVSPPRRPCNVQI